MGQNLTKKSTSKYILDEKTFKRYEKYLLEYSGLSKEEFKQESIEVNSAKIGETNTGCSIFQVISISTITSGDPNNPPLVWLHGYGAAGALFYKLMPHLIEKFRVYFVDIIGMGGSSRAEDFNPKATPEETVEYFTSYLEKWRDKMNIDKFYLAGHSFGGYIAGLYTAKYPQNVIKLHLVSPIGCRVTPEGETWQQRFEERPDGSGPPGYVKPMMGFFWKKKFSPFGPGRFMG